MINVAILVLARLRSRRIEGYSDLRAFAKKTVAGGDTLFLPSLNFLFLLGLVEYRPKTDAIEYLGPQ